MTKISIAAELNKPSNAPEQIQQAGRQNEQQPRSQQQGEGNDNDTATTAELANRNSDPIGPDP